MEPKEGEEEEEQIVVKKRKKTIVEPLLKDQRTLFNRNLFSVYMHVMLDEESKKISDLLAPDAKWKMDPAFIEEMHFELSRLLKRIVEKSSFFGKYRILSITQDPEQKVNKKKPLVNVKESDFNFGWRAIKSDAMGE